MLDKSAAVVCSTRRNRRNKPDAIHTGMPKGECCAKTIKTQRGKNPESALISIDHQEEATHQTAHYANYPLDTEPIGTAEQRLQLQLCLTRQGSVRSADRSLSAWSAYSVYFMLRLSWFFSIRASMTDWCCVWWLSYSFKGRRQGEDETMHVQTHFTKKKLCFLIMRCCNCVE